MINRLLKYWYALEFFQPNWPDNVRDGENLERVLGNELVWCDLESGSDPDTMVYYDVYVGRGLTCNLSEWLLNALGHGDDEIVERDNSQIALFGIKLTEGGVYCPGSFAISGFGWAVGALANGRGDKLTEDDVKRFQNECDLELFGDEAAFTFNGLLKLLKEICSKIELADGLFLPEVWIKRDIYKRDENGEFPKINNFTELMQSFYIADIARIMEKSSDLVENFGQALLDESKKRHEIDIDATVMSKWLDAERFPIGAWPSSHSPSLMQQLAINLSISGQKMTAVNGPPGTGKTTLLKEVVASNVVKRALLLVEYNNPDDAFEREDFSEPPDDFNRTFYVPNHKLTEFGIIVASNNNAAVENVSKELPRAIKNNRTGHFSEGSGYFADIATGLLGEECWGLISAPLGKRSHINRLKERLWWAEDGANLKRYFDDDYPRPHWKTACENFRKAYENVQEARKNIACAQGLIPRKQQALESLQHIEQELHKATEECAACEQSLEDRKGLVLRLETDSAKIEKDIEAVQKKLPLFTKILRPLLRKNQSLQDLQKLNDEHSRLAVSAASQRSEIRKLEEMYKNLESQVKNLAPKADQLKSDLSALEKEIEQAKQIFGSNFADPAFFRDSIANNSASQKACPWTYFEYDKLREELFFQSLMLHKAFVLNSNAAEQNIRRLMTMWGGKFTAKDRAFAFSSLLNTLQLIIPVISTTFASVQSFLSDVGEGELGVLVIDEAGQATPQSALGAIWRTKRAIVVGDPLQVEPIMSVPKVLMHHFAQEYNLPPKYRFAELSVQNLADAQSVYGGFRKIGDGKLWLGCPLIVHRRCIEPMFSISNQVAYGERMLCETRPPDPNKEFVLEHSCWFDIKGASIGKKNHSVPAQTEFVAQLIQKAIGVYQGLPPVYIITPFNTVKNALHESLKVILKSSLPTLTEDSIQKWLNKNCGTIHTFQGKEADEVILVLGCDDASSQGAAQWAGQKPNLINVAASRAKYRLAVVGDFDLWRKIDFVNVACKFLEINGAI